VTRQLRAIGGAVPLGACRWCLQPVTACTAPSCIAAGHVHLRSRLHKCGNGVSLAFPLAVRS